MTQSSAKPHSGKPQAAKPTWAFSNDQWIPTEQASLALDDLGCLQGVIAVERLRTYSGKLHLPERYANRLRSTVAYLGIGNAESRFKYEQILAEFIARHTIPSDGSDDLGITCLVTPGRPQHGPTVIVHGSALPWSRIAKLGRTGQRLFVSDVAQVPIACWPRSLKVRSRLHYYLADRQAQQLPHAPDALLRDLDGCVTESSTGNLLVIEDRTLICPPADRVLPGITLGRLVELALSLGFKYVEEFISTERLERADEVLMTGTTVGPWPITHVNDQPIGEGAPGPLTRQLQHAWCQEVGIDPWQQAAQQAVQSAVH